MMLYLAVLGLAVGPPTARLGAPTPRLGVSFAPGGLLFPYYFGVAVALRDAGLITPSTPLGGSSAGAIVAAAVACEVPEAVVLDGLSSLVADVRAGVGLRVAVRQQLLALREHFFTIRELFRKIGDLADVPVEPPCQTKLCDATMEQPGAVICGVPGAGGFDAVFAVVINSCRSNIERFWAEKTDAQVCALLLRESRAHPGILLSSE